MRSRACGAESHASLSGSAILGSRAALIVVHGIPRDVEKRELASLPLQSGLRADGLLVPRQGGYGAGGTPDVVT